jgi:hypothetical protein
VRSSPARQQKGKGVPLSGKTFGVYGFAVSFPVFWHFRFPVFWYFRKAVQKQQPHAPEA